MYWCPLVDLTMGPTQSIAIRSNGTSMIGNGTRGLLKWDTGAVSWHSGQELQYWFTSSHTPGQKNLCRILSRVFSAPKCPPSTCLCAKSSTSLR
ncbi:hypothetical protein GDO81_023075 [Engystomops pustulosus]|uniref:Uncharacterized protein n=1 Tax=Engystomops pustulosus TaxID=76066 RepID=A0AAV6YLB8_ENGPU|nr:hypothetical protein GDO81_023075 [Engystomops pustulosus]